jgi:hypothetical protein
VRLITTDDFERLVVVVSAKFAFCHTKIS